MFKRFYPALSYGSFREISPAFLTEKGITALLVDIDNTLVPWDAPLPTPEVSEWVRRMKEAGIGICLISNNHEDRVKTFNEPLGLPVVFDAGKPGKACYETGLELLGASREQTAVLGDQLFTDIWGGNRRGLYSILVEPVADRDMPFVRFKRYLEKIVLYFYRKRKFHED